MGGEGGGGGTFVGGFEARGFGHGFGGGGGELDLWGWRLKTVGGGVDGGKDFDGKV